MISQDDSLVHWNLPQLEGLFQIFCEVTNSDGLKTTSSVSVLVKKSADGTTKPFAYYPLDGNVLDLSGNRHDATLQGAQLAEDPRGEIDKAYQFSSSGDIIFVPHEPILNFQDQITLSFWVKLDAVPQESFILSHGSWEERWKVSVTPDRKLRWTVKTSTGTKDLDSSFPLALNHYYHFAVVYTGYSLELYDDGVLDTFIEHAGQIATTAKDITFGRKDKGVSNYFLRGSLDEVRIYDKGLEPNEIATLKLLWNNITPVGESIHTDFFVYPNPSQGLLNIKSSKQIKNIALWDITGREVKPTQNYQEDKIHHLTIDATPGILILKIETADGVFYRKIRIR